MAVELNFRIGTRGNGFIWAVSDAVERSDLDCVDHEDWIYSHLQPKRGTYVDVGAFVGTHAIRIAKSGVPVIAFEPVPEHVALLRLNMALNQVQFPLWECAVGETAGIVSFTCGGLAESHISDHREQSKTVQVPLVTLDDTLAGVDDIEVLKIDVEGYEWQVLNGARAICRKHKPRIVVEVHSHLPGFEAMGNYMALWCEQEGYRFERIWENTPSYYYLRMEPK